MIIVSNKIPKPSKGRGIIPSAEYIMYNSIIPSLLSKLKRIPTNGNSVKVTLTGKIDKFEIQTDCEDETILKKIRSLLK